MSRRTDFDQTNISTKTSTTANKRNSTYFECTINLLLSIEVSMHDVHHNKPELIQ